MEELKSVIANKRTPFLMNSNCGPDCRPVCTPSMVCEPQCHPAVQLPVFFQTCGILKSKNFIINNLKDFRSSWDGY